MEGAGGTHFSARVNDGGNRMFSTKWRFTLAVGLLGALVVLSLLASAGCNSSTQTSSPKASNTKTGKVEGFAVSIPLGGTTATYRGTITVKLDDGTSVDATCAAAIANDLKGGEEVTIKETASGGWEVIGPATVSPPASSNASTGLTPAPSTTPTPTPTVDQRIERVVANLEWAQSCCNRAQDAASVGHWDRYNHDCDLAVKRFGRANKTMPHSDTEQARLARTYELDVRAELLKTWEIITAFYKSMAVGYRDLRESHAYHDRAVYAYNDYENYVSSISSGAP
jgi:hypothetical protein